MLVAFGMSPAAFGANVAAEQLYKNTYIELQQGKDSVQVLKNLMAAAKTSKLEIKDVLEAAVAKGYMSQEQLNTVLDVAQKNAHITQDVSGKKLSKADVQKIADALKGQVTGASYYCGYYGCYHSNATVVFTVLLLALLFTPVYVVVY